jgi:hypothetical protein
VLDCKSNNDGSIPSPAFILKLHKRLTGVEPVTYGAEIRCSIQLSYKRVLIYILFCPSGEIGRHAKFRL